MIDQNIMYAIRGLGVLVLFVVVWDLYWKGLALWKSGQQKQKGWFIALLIINSMGILPIIYLLFFQKKTKKS